MNEKFSIPAMAKIWASQIDRTGALRTLYENTHL